MSRLPRSRGAGGRAGTRTWQEMHLTHEDFAPCHIKADVSAVERLAVKMAQ